MSPHHLLLIAAMARASRARTLRLLIVVYATHGIHRVFFFQLLLKIAYLLVFISLGAVFWYLLLAFNRRMLGLRTFGKLGILITTSMYIVLTAIILHFIITGEAVGILSVLKSSVTLLVIMTNTSRGVLFLKLLEQISNNRITLAEINNQIDNIIHIHRHITHSKLLILIYIVRTDGNTFLNSSL